MQDTRFEIMAEYLLPPQTVLPLALVEVEPLIETTLCPSMTKIILREKSLASSLCIEVDKVSSMPSLIGLDRILCSGYIITHDSTINDQNNRHQYFLQGNDPTLSDSIPCRIRGYAVTSHAAVLSTHPPEDPSTLGPLQKRKHCVVTEGTFIRVISFTNEGADSGSVNSFLNSLIGETSAQFKTEGWDKFILSCHDVSTIESLALRMGMQLRRHHLVGTTSDALEVRNCSIRRAERCIAFTDVVMRQRNERGRSKQNTSSSTTELKTEHSSHAFLATSLFDEGSLCVFDDVHGSGKTELVKAIARTKCGCRAIHVITAGTLFAKYGVRADSGLECLLHSAAMSAAARGERICIILDRLGDFIPMPDRSDKGDPSGPCLHAMGEYVA